MVFVFVTDLMFFPVLDLDLMFVFVLVLRCGNIRPLAEDFVPDGCYQPCPEGTLELCGGGGQRSHEWNVFSTNGENKCDSS